jgi:hypothetical protein
MTTSAQADPEKLKGYLKTIFGSLGGAMTSALIGLGDRLGLSAARRLGAATSAELARETGLHERWRASGCQQGASGILDHVGDGRFALSAEGMAVLVDENHPAFGAGFFLHLPQTMAVVEKLPEAFRTGVGLPYDAFGPEGAQGIERSFAPWFRALLVPFALPKLPGVVERLREGGHVADVGCGAGVALLEMAKAFPKSEFTATRSRASRSCAPRRTRSRPASRTRTSTTRASTACPRTRASTSSPPSTACTTCLTRSRSCARSAARSGRTASG